MFTIWQENTALSEPFDNAFNALAHMKILNIEGKVKDETGKTIVSLSENGVDWLEGSSPLTSLTKRDAAFLLGRSLSLVNQFCNTGRMGHKFGNAWAITMGELERFSAEERLSGVGFSQTKRKFLKALLKSLSEMGYDVRKYNTIKREMDSNLPTINLINCHLNGVRISVKENKMFLVNGLENNPDLRKLKKEYND